MDRRDVLRLAIAAPAAIALATRARAQDAPPVSLRLRLNLDRAATAIPADFMGLSYEGAALSDPAIFSPDNAQLIGFVRRLGLSGVLRIGGNTSDYSTWEPLGASANAPPPAGPDAGRQAPPLRPITPLAIRNLRGFLDATGWRLIYGLNLGTGRTETVAAEAAFVAKEMGPKLVTFQLGNEPDRFGHNGLRNPDYQFAQFAAEWRRRFSAVRARVPNAPFGGPDAAENNNWVVQFARDFGNDVQMLSRHYYALGPPSDSSATIERLLDPHNTRFDALLEGMRAAREAAPKVPLRVTETNSCYGGGKPGVSNTFASALWGLDLMYRMAWAGAAGVNFHGGRYGWYSPIAGMREAGFVARPLYYGMLMFAEAGSGQLVSTSLDNRASAPLFDAYALKNSHGQVKLVLVNKHAVMNVRVAATGVPSIGAHLLWLLAPRLDDTQDITLGAIPIGAYGGWGRPPLPHLDVKDGMLALTVPRASAVLVTFG